MQTHQGLSEECLLAAAHSLAHSQHHMLDAYCWIGGVTVHLLLCTGISALSVWPPTGMVLLLLTCDCALASALCPSSSRCACCRLAWLEASWRSLSARSREAAENCCCREARLALRCSHSACKARLQQGVMSGAVRTDPAR